MSFVAYVYKQGCTTGSKFNLFELIGVRYLNISNKVKLGHFT